MIGNGFDLACGLNTRYTDMYKLYCRTESKNDNIRDFKKEISKENYKCWADFELALPQFGKNKNDFDKFRECIIDFSDFLEDYLMEEQNKINLENSQINQILQMGLYHPYEYCLQLSKNSLEPLYVTPTDNCICNFITFNYTDSLEKCLSKLEQIIKKNNTCIYTYKNPIHIHGTLNNAILLGLDNEELYKDIPCKNFKRLQNFIDKVYSNNRRSNICNDAVKLLRESNIILILGWSMGDSDSFWVNKIKETFAKNPALNIIYTPYYSEPINKRRHNQTIDREDEQKDFIAQRFEISEDMRYRIHIITNPNYMNLNFLTDVSSVENTTISNKELITV
ncbi:MAG: AbiH family protein [Oscillospiraceae bacterium]